ncbi:MFS transporter [Thermosediminibacter litoriperuensis]|uniref:ACDE family multidrug resistance protein n=1 Tax=Thermosediminibacter litoriperuensis TaxID=291989 RepID=A0A5S5AXY5_9FIRM|nr:MFS transporter [Thermosediminibacter litoriperuensis]TYP57626.1 ACDE family multidrug resistance protein [Thermosediminibacter litoriperuensis]
MKKSTGIQLVLLCLVPFIMVLGNSMLIPVLPAIKKAVGINQFQVGLFITAFSIPAGLVIPFAGVLSDQIGRKKVMAPALIIYGVGGIVAGLSSVFLKDPYWGILTGRIIQGVGAGGTYQLAMAIVGDTFSSEERSKALGLLEASNGLGKVVSPILGASLALIIWYFPFFAYGILAIPAGIILYIFVKEKTEFKKQSLENYTNSLKAIFEKKAAGLLTSFFAGMAALFSLFGILSLYSDILETNFDAVGFKKGLIISGPVLVMASLSFALGILLEKRKNKGLKTFILVGLILIVSGHVMFALVKEFWPLFLSVLILGAGVGLIMTPVNALVTGSCSVKRRGIITCLYGSLRFFGVAVGPPVYAFSERYGILTVVLAAGSLSLIALIISVFLLVPGQILSEQKN